MGKFALCFILSFLFFFTTGFSLYPFREICSSSCGPLQEIKFPFRVKGDPHYCGNAKYELVCDSNATVLTLSSREYHVASISYDRSELHLIDAGLASGTCRIPLGRSVSPRVIREDGRYQPAPDTGWASFVNCTDTVMHQLYHPVPCLGSQSIYVVSGYEVKDLEPSCRFLAMASTLGSIDNGSTTDVFVLLKKGFAISWISTPKTFGYCLVGYLSATKYVANGGMYQMMGNIILLDFGFLKCVYESKDASNLPIAIAFVVVLNFLLIALIGRLIIAPLCLLAFMGYEFCNIYLSANAIEKFLRTQPPLTPTRYAYNDIVKFTNNFKEKLGQGGFGLVFRGKLPGGSPVAVKMLKSSKCGGDDFISEVSTIGMIHHVNVVRLLGFCSEGSRRALVYEYMPNGSLDKYVLSSTGPRAFVREKLNDIALGVARGIDYLHQGCDMRILHFDIKPHNVLLDEDFSPKVSDFGLAKLYPKDYSFVSMSVMRGTIGYIAPELVSRSFGPISHKSDVYSYGMLVLEIAGGRRDFRPKAEGSSETYYPSWIYDRLDRRERLGTDGTEEAASEAERGVLSAIDDVERKLCKVGLWCIQMKPADRPAMSGVIEMLEGSVDDLPMPPKPFFSPPPPPPPQTDFVDQSYSGSSATESSVIEEYE